MRVGGDSCDCERVTHPRPEYGQARADRLIRAAKRLAASVLPPYRTQFRDQGGLDISAIFFRKARIAAAIAGAAIISACAPAPAAVGSGSEKPTFVSLNPCLDALLVELADPDQILALSHYSRDASSSSIDPATARQFAFTGGTAEEVLALEPDIVLASTYMPPATRAAFERLGLRVETFGSPATVSESLEQIRQLAAKAGREEEGWQLVARIEQSLGDPVSGEWISTMMWQPGQIVPGETTLVADVLRRTGFTSHSAAQGMGQGDYVSLESVLAAPPELLLVAGGSTGQTHPLLERIESTHVETIDTRLLYCGGPTIIDLRERLEAVRDAIHESAST